MLKNGKWARKYDKCITCGTTEHNHCGNGVCIACYEKKRSNRPSRIRATREYKKKYAENHPEVVAKCRDTWNKWYKGLNEVFVILNKGRRWKKYGWQCIEYKLKPIPLDITSRDPEVQRKWQEVKNYIDNRTKLGRKL